MMELYRKLEPLKIYALKRDSLIDCELSAYGAALDGLDARLEELLLQAFVQTASGEKLLLHENLVGLGERPDTELGQRRSLVLYRRSVAPFDFNLAGMKSSMLAVGIEADIAEDSGGEVLTVLNRRLIEPFMDLDSIKLSLLTMLPAHLEIVFDIGGLTWDAFDESDPAWDEWDSKDFTWNEFDTDGPDIFQSSN